MKKGKFILGAAAFVVTAISAFAFTVNNKKGAGTLFTKQGTRVPCVSVDAGHGFCSSAITYYTAALVNKVNPAYVAD